MVFGFNNWLKDGATGFHEYFGRVLLSTLLLCWLYCLEHFVHFHFDFLIYFISHVVEAGMFLKTCFVFLIFSFFSSASLPNLASCTFCYFYDFFFFFFFSTYVEFMTIQFDDLEKKIGCRIKLVNHALKTRLLHVCIVECVHCLWAGFGITSMLIERVGIF